MRWIILTQDRPAQLHALLESAVEFLPTATPDIISSIENYNSSGIGILASRILAYFHTVLNVHKDYYKDKIQYISNWPRPDGSLDPMILFTTDTMLFTRRVILQDAWTALQDPNTLGLSLTHCPTTKGIKLRDGRFTKNGSIQYVWDWKDDGFAFGTIYRTSDILGPLHNNTYDSPETLRDALCKDTTLRRRTRMACLSDSSLIDVSLRSEQAEQRYLNGEVIDIARLREDQTKLHWKLYE
jgi:hypothetical protein